MIYILGGANMDMYGRPEKALNLHDSNVGDIKLVHGGVGRNITESLARLSQDVTFMSAFGNDDFGKTLRSRLIELGVNIDGCLVTDELKTATYMAVLNDEGDMEVAICDNRVVGLLTPKSIAAFVAKAKGDDILVMDANLNEEVIAAAMELTNARIFVDPLSQAKAMKLRHHLNKIYAFKPNIYEAEVLYGKPIVTDEDLYDVGTFFLEKGISHIYLSLGEKGMYYRSKTESMLIRSTREEMVNASGAGDACMAGIIYGHANELDLHDIVELAMSNAVLAIQSEDTVPQDLSEEKLLNRKKDLTFEWRKLECK